MIVTNEYRRFLVERVIDAHVEAVKVAGVGIGHGKRCGNPIGIHGAVRDRQRLEQRNITRRNILPCAAV